MRDRDIRVVGLGGTLREGSASLGAVRRTLEAAERAGARTELLDLNELRLPMYEPGRDLADYPEDARRLVEALRGADGVVLGTAAYHGTLAGVTKNVLDYAQFLGRDARPYMDGRVVGLVSTAGGDQGAVNANRAMADVVHSLRGVVAPLMVTVPHAWKNADGEGNITDERIRGRLDALGELLVELAEKLGADHEEDRRFEAVGLAV